MDFRINFQLKDKKPWWIDGVFYVVVSLVIVAIFCYGILIIRNFQQRQEILSLEQELNHIRTDAEKFQETEVLRYQKKISDFSYLLSKHALASNVFSFVQKNTVVDVWLKQFSMDQKTSQLQISGQAGSLASFSRQLANFENNEQVKSVGVISSSLADSNKVDFSFNLSIDPKVFAYIEPKITVVGNASAGDGKPSTNPNPNQSGVQLSGDKIITSFRLVMNPGVVGVIDQVKRVITVTVPSGTNITGLKATVLISPKAKISPDTTLPVDFSRPVTYTVIAEDGTQQTYQVIVTIAKQTP